MRRGRHLSSADARPHVARRALWSSSSVPDEGREGNGRHGAVPADVEDVGDRGSDIPVVRHEARPRQGFCPRERVAVLNRLVEAVTALAPARAAGQVRAAARGRTSPPGPWHRGRSPRPRSPRLRPRPGSRSWSIIGHIGSRDERRLRDPGTPALRAVLELRAPPAQSVEEAEEGERITRGRHQVLDSSRPGDESRPRATASGRAEAETNARPDIPLRGDELARRASEASRSSSSRRALLGHPVASEQLERGRRGSRSSSRERRTPNGTTQAEPAGPRAQSSAARPVRGNDPIDVPRVAPAPPPELARTAPLPSPPALARCSPASARRHVRHGMEPGRKRLQGPRTTGDASRVPTARISGISDLMRGQGVERSRAAYG